MTYWFRSFSGLLTRELKRFMKVPAQTIGTPIVSSLLYLLIFGITLGRSIELGSSISYLTFLLPGLMMMFLLRNAFENSTSSLITGKYLGELQDLRIVPLDSWQILSAHALASLLRGLLVALIVYIFGQACHYYIYHSFILVAHPAWLLYFLVVGGLCFAFFGICVGMFARHFEHVSAISSFVLTPLLYLGGIFIPIKELHSFWQTLSYGNPLLYLISGVRYGMIGYSDVNLLASVGFTLFLTLLFCSLAFFSLQKGKNYTR